MTQEFESLGSNTQLDPHTHEFKRKSAINKNSSVSSSDKGKTLILSDRVTRSNFKRGSNVRLANEFERKPTNENSSNSNSNSEKLKLNNKTQNKFLKTAQNSKKESMRRLRSKTSTAKKKLKSYKEHHCIKINDKQNSFKCIDCSYTAVTSYKVARHYKRIHTLVYSEKCSICLKLFKHPEDVRNHKYRVHKSE